jgi:signal transduction histidine kinase
MDRLTVELSALTFQTVVTGLLALVYFALWRQRRRSFDGTWALAWGFYATRLLLISAFILSRNEVWLLLHQVATGTSAMLLLYATLQFFLDAHWSRARFAWILAAIVLSSFVTIYGISSVAGGVVSAALLSAVTLWTGVVFWRHRARQRSTGATVLAVTFTLWGLHHLDYPLLRSFGTAVLFGVAADVLFITATAVGALFLVLDHERRTLEVRSAQLEQLTRLLLTAQEDERRRIARELHDEAGQILTAVKIDLDLSGQRASAELVGQALAQVRDLSNLLRPTVLDNLGLLPAVRALVEDFGMRTRIQVEVRTEGEIPSLTPDQKVAIYRIVQEGLTNVGRHAGANRVTVALVAEPARVRLTIEDDGRGPGNELTPNLGLLGMRERISALGGSLLVGAAEHRGFQVAVEIPTGSRT